MESVKYPDIYGNPIIVGKRYIITRSTNEREADFRNYKNTWTKKMDKALNHKIQVRSVEREGVYGIIRTVEGVNDIGWPWYVLLPVASKNQVTIDDNCNGIIL